MHSAKTPAKDQNPPAEPALAQVLDLLGTSDNYDLAWLFESRATGGKGK